MSVSEHDVDFEQTTLEEGIGQVNWCLENGGINTNNYEVVHRIISKFGQDAHEVFQEASEQLAQLVAEGIVVEPSAQAAAELS